MKPIAIFRHAAAEGPGYLAEFLDARSLPWQLIRIDAGDPVPVDASQFSGLVFMGGPMSVNDDLPWIEPVLSLIRDAVARDIPVLGHCLGGQTTMQQRAHGWVMSKAPLRFTGTAKPSACPQAPSICYPASTAPTRPMHWASTSRCNAMLK
jgi:GMP synthase-like glutamine amidotransferase